MRKDVLFAGITANMQGSIQFLKRNKQKESIRSGYSFYLSAQFGHIYRQILYVPNNAEKPLG